MIAAVTGHRPERIDNWQFVEAQLRHAFIDLNVSHLLQGMAAGVDLEAAKIAYLSRIPYTAVRPWAGHGPAYGWADKYKQAQIHAHDEVIVVDKMDFPGNWVYQKRNEWMVDHARVLIAVWDQSQAGGTWNCINYALRQNVPVWNIDVLGLKSDWL